MKVEAGSEDQQIQGSDDEDSFNLHIGTAQQDIKETLESLQLKFNPDLVKKLTH